MYLKKNRLRSVGSLDYFTEQTVNTVGTVRIRRRVMKRAEGIDAPLRSPTGEPQTNPLIITYFDGN